MIQKKTKQSFAKEVVLDPPKKNLTIHHNQIAVAVLGRIEIIHTTQILFLKADSNYTEIHLVDGTMILVSKTMKNFHKRLSGRTFLRVHSGFIIQSALIKAFWPTRNKLILKSGQEIPVARSKKEALMKYLKGMMV